MALRQEATKRKWLPITLAILLFGVAGTVTGLQLYHPLPRASPPRSVYFYDLTNDQLFAAKGAIPPIIGPSGDHGNGKGTAVIAHVYSCGDCGNEADRFVGYLENSSDALQQANTNGIGAAGRAAAPRFSRMKGGGMEVADQADKKTWVGMETPEGTEIMKRAMSKCGEDKTPQECIPAPRA